MSYRRASPNWQKKEQERIPQLSNRELLDETLELAGGNDYDGGYTPDGQITYHLLHNELYLRLYDWLDKPLPKKEDKHE